MIAKANGMKREPNEDIIFGELEDEVAISDLAAFTLLDDESRREFLFTFYWIGETALFAAVSHVWARLAEPRAWRCTLIGQLSGPGGQGKTALILTLQKFLAEALAINNPLPDPAKFATLETWHVEAMAAFDADRSQVQELCAVYSSVLNGGSEAGSFGPRMAR